MRSVDYRMEVLKNGQQVEERPVGDDGRGHATFGRTPNADFVLEHPSASRCVRLRAAGAVRC